MFKSLFSVNYPRIGTMLKPSPNFDSNSMFQRQLSVQSLILRLGDLWAKTHQKWSFSKDPLKALEMNHKGGREVGNFQKENPAQQ